MDWTLKEENGIAAVEPTGPGTIDDLVEAELFVELTTEDASNSAENGATQPLSWGAKCSHRSGKVSKDKAPRIGDQDPDHQEHIPVPAIIGTIDAEFERCRQTLKHAITHCFQLDFTYVACAISCVLNSLRPLHTWEVDKAVDLFVEYTDAEHCARDNEDVGERLWLQKCSSFLVVDGSGLVRFASSVMPQFLKQFRIRGIDTTHQTIATACLIQVDLNERLEHCPMARSITRSPADANLAFSGYAGTHWQEHCRSAEQSCQDLAAVACAGPVSDAMIAHQDRSMNMAANADADLDIIGFQNLSLDEDDMDWDFFDQE